MPITLKCGCGKHLKVRDELAGKRARCPGCGTILPVPSPITRQPLVRQEKLVPQAAEEEPEEPVVSRAKRTSSSREEEDDYEGIRQKRMPTDEEPDEVDEQDDEPRRRRKKKKKRTKSVLFTPLLTLFGIDMTPLKLMIVGVVFLMVGFFTFMYFSGAEAKVRVVDIYDLEEDLSEFCQGRPQMDVILNFLFHKQIPRPFVVQENSKGTFLLVQFKLSERDLKKLVGERYENFVMKGKDVVLQGDGEPVHPLFIYEPDKNTPSVTVKVKSMVEEEMEKDGLGGLAGKGDKGDDAGPPFEAHNKLIAPSAENPWTHEGVLKVDPSSKSTFQGVRGMIVTFDHGPLPSKEVKITWNEKCKFWHAVKEEEVPSEVFLYAWRITCLFPKPESTKNLKLTVLGRQMKMDYP
jgi:hypothetical protein